MKERIITLRYLRENPNHVFVFGDNKLRRGKKGAAILRDEPNAYGFITKKYPSFNNDAYYKPSEYLDVYHEELKKLTWRIDEDPKRTFLISKLGAGLANKFGIWEKVIRDTIGNLKVYDNVEFLFELEEEK